MEECAPANQLSLNVEPQNHNAAVFDSSTQLGGELLLKAEEVLIINDEADEPEPELGGIHPAVDPTGYYLQGIGRIPMLTAEQEVSLAERIQVGLRVRKELQAKDTVPASVAVQAQLAEIVED